jgi:hypothetical protein
VYALVDPFVKLCLLRRNPQDLPTSRSLLNAALAGYFLISAVLGMRAYGLPRSLLQAGVEVAILILYTRMLLTISARPERIVQTLSALAGSGLLLGIAALPLSVLVPSGDALAGLPALAYLALMVWSLIVYGHIFRHALSRGQLAGLLAALGFVLCTGIATALLFGIPGSS